MPSTQNPAVMKWLQAFAFVVAFLVLFGGLVRLTRSGLSIVEWNPISGILPPIGQQAWEEEFAKYQLTPEYRKINAGMSLDEYRFIFYMEWVHRILARLAGLFYAIPVLYFLIKRSIPFKEFGVYFLMGLLFIGQAFMGWFMVASGLVDRPAVSHFRLTIHLLFALTLMGLALWTAFGHRYGFPNPRSQHKRSAISRLSLVATLILIIQIAYGGMTAGLKAGHVSNTWPLMFGQWIPANLFTSWINLFETPQTIVFVHRWFAWLGILFVPYAYFLAKNRGYPQELQRGLIWLTAAVVLQITLGVLTVLSYVNIVMALLHQGNALVLFGLAIFFLHRFRAVDASTHPA